MDSCDIRLNSQHISYQGMPFKELNHPFYFIHYKEKELAIIGT
jgi:hypothetical protein